MTSCPHRLLSYCQLFRSNMKSREFNIYRQRPSTDMQLFVSELSHYSPLSQLQLLINMRNGLTPRNTRPPSEPRSCQLSTGDKSHSKALELVASCRDRSVSTHLTVEVPFKSTGDVWPQLWLAPKVLIAALPAWAPGSKITKTRKWVGWVWSQSLVNLELNIFKCNGLTSDDNRWLSTRQEGRNLIHRWHPSIGGKCV